MPLKTSAAAAQCQQVLDHLASGIPLTSLEALHRYGIGRLAARIFDLKKRGHPIARCMVTVQKSDGTTACVASYSL